MPPVTRTVIVSVSVAFAASDSTIKARDRKTKANKLGKVVYSVTAY